jgi:hypothetical protein
MATIDWPTTDAFKPTLPYSFGVSTPKSGARGFYTGENETVGHLSDRLLVNMNLPPCSGQQAKERAAFLIGAMSNGDRFRFSPWNANFPHGTISGGPTVGAAAAAGARSINISGARSGLNLLRGGGFEIDTDANGLADGWTLYATGSTGTVSVSRVGGNSSPFAQRFDATALGASASDQVGAYYSADVDVVAGNSYAFSADCRDNGVQIRLHIDWYNVSAALISSTTSVAAGPGSSWSRRSVSGVAPVAAAAARPYVWMEARTGGPASSALEIDNVQFQLGAVAAAFSGNPTLAGGDLLAVGGNLLTTAYAGSTLSDAGAGSVPLALPLLRPLTIGQSITLINPVGTWQIDTTDGIAFDFAANVLQMGVNIPFRQVAV